MVDERLKYVTPRLTVYGSIQEITQNGNGKEPNSADGANGWPPGKTPGGTDGVGGFGHYKS